MGMIPLAHDLSSRHLFLINFSKLLLGAEVSFNRKLNWSLQAVNNGIEADVTNIPVFLRVYQWPTLIFARNICYSISYFLGRFNGFNLL